MPSSFLCIAFEKYASAVSYPYLKTSPYSPSLYYKSALLYKVLQDPCRTPFAPFEIANSHSLSILLWPTWITGWCNILRNKVIHTPIFTKCGVWIFQAYKILHPPNNSDGFSAVKSAKWCMNQRNYRNITPCWPATDDCQYRIALYPYSYVSQ